MWIGDTTPWIPDEPAEGGYWRELTEIQAEKLADAHGGGESLVEVGPDENTPSYPQPDGAWSWQLLEASDGFQILLVHDGDGLEHYYVVDAVGPGTLYPELEPGLRWWHYGIIGGIGAGLGYWAFHPRYRCPWPALIGGAVTMAGAGVVDLVLRRRAA